MDRTPTLAFWGFLVLVLQGEKGGNLKLDEVQGLRQAPGPSSSQALWGYVEEALAPTG